MTLNKLKFSGGSRKQLLFFHKRNLKNFSRQILTFRVTKTIWVVLVVDPSKVKVPVLILLNTFARTFGVEAFWILAKVANIGSALVM